ncbi:MAG: SDR family oxidoreductase [Chloroflexi bacterium]|nr:SDR family oxidoreductase [Chloroflexota bacterium]
MAEQPGPPVIPAPFPDLFRLDGRVALVTGGAGLLGRRYCEALLQAGARVVIGDLDGQRAEDLAAELAPDAAFGRKLDVTHEESVRATVHDTVERFRRLDILVNNAALTVRGGSEQLSPAAYFAPFEDYQRAVWEQAINVNLTGMLLCAQAAGRQMLDQAPSGGVIVNISSTYGVVAPDQRLYEGVTSPYAETGFNTPVSYAVTKTAVLGLTRYLATYWGRKNIRVNALTPHGVYDRHDESFVANFAYRSPLGRMARNDEYRGALLFLVSDASSYMTGANLIVDGGWTAW